jgi:o-succinylbenzoate---CoA ligase
VDHVDGDVCQQIDDEAGVIDFESSESHLLLNPRMPADERTRLETIASRISLTGHVLLATSGSTGAIKLVALSKDAILASAAAVNARLEATSNDFWCAVLPHFHVGGLGIWARAGLSGARVVSMPWDPVMFAHTEATLASLVPAQVHDLLQHDAEPPPRLRAVLVGGGAFDPGLEARAIARGWPVLASYGMSEAASTVAVRDVLLAHIEARAEGGGRLAFRGSSLFTGYVTEDGLVDPKRDGWFLSEDIGEVDGRVLRVEGREGELIKIGGESVDLKRLDRIADEAARACGGDAGVAAVADERLGRVIHLAVTAEGIAERFNESVLPFERARAVHRIAAIPRSPLGKILRARLAAELGR